MGKMVICSSPKWLLRRLSSRYKIDCSENSCWFKYLLSIFIDVKTGKVGKVLSAYMDMEPEEVADGDIGGVSMEFDVRDLLKKRRVRKVERSLDGELVVKEGYLIEGREFEWESTQAV